MLLVIGYYLSMPVSRRSSVEFVREVLGWRSEWKYVFYAIFVWWKVWVRWFIEWRETRRRAAQVREREVQEKLYRREDGRCWDEPAKEPKKAVMQVQRPPRKVRKVVARRSRG